MHHCVTGFQFLAEECDIVIHGHRRRGAHAAAFGYMVVNLVGCDVHTVYQRFAVPNDIQRRNADLIALYQFMGQVAGTVCGNFNIHRIYVPFTEPDNTGGMSLWYHNIRHTASFFADTVPPAAFVSFRLYSPAKTGIIHKKAPSHDGIGRWEYGGAEHRCAVYQGHWRDTGQSIGKAGGIHPAGSDRLLSPPVRGPQRHLSHRGIAGGRDRLLPGHDRRSPHQPPDPRRTHAGKGAGRGRHRRAGCDLFQSGLPPAEPPRR